MTLNCKKARLISEITPMHFSLNLIKINGISSMKQEQLQKLPDGGGHNVPEEGQIEFSHFMHSITHKLDKYSGQWQKKPLLLNILSRQIILFFQYLKLFFNAHRRLENSVWRLEIVFFYNICTYLYIRMQVPKLRNLSRVL